MTNPMTKPSMLSLAAAVAVATTSQALAGAPDYSVSGRITGPDGGWDYSSFDPVHRRLYVSRANGVTAVDVDTRTVTAQLTAVGKAHESLPLAQGSMLLVTDSVANSAHLVDALTGAAIADVPTGQKPDGAVFDPSTGLALVMNGKSGDVTLIAPAAHKAVGDVMLGGALESAAADGAGRVFVNIEDQNRIAVIDVAKRAVVARYPLAGCDAPGGLAYAPEAGLLIAACQNNVAKVVAAADGHEVATLAIGAGPDAVIYDPARRLAFIPCGRAGKLYVIAVRGPRDVGVAQTLATRIGARSGAVDPKTGAVYLPTASFDPPATAGGRPTPRPGTFEILVVTPAAPAP
jgi:DNA-binding beta-propeller fold protein YncE